LVDGELVDSTGKWKGKMIDDFDDDEPIYVVEFSGRDADWIWWVQRFVEQAREMHFDEILSGTIKAPPESETLSLDRGRQEEGHGKTAE